MHSENPKELLLISEVKQQSAQLLLEWVIVFYSVGLLDRQGMFLLHEVVEGRRFKSLLRRFFMVANLFFKTDGHQLNGMVIQKMSALCVVIRRFINS